jgi:hypothetical protein
MQLPWQQLSWYFIFLRAGLKAIMLTMDSPRLAAAKLTSRTGHFLAALASQILK